MGKGPIIALDGPAGAGKSTVAKAVAERLGLLYLDTGAMYRAVTWAVIQSDIHPQDQRSIERLLQSINLEFFQKDGKVQIRLDGNDISTEIRSASVTKLVPLVAENPSVRHFLVQWQRKIAEQGNIVVDGRDIGTYVLPHADCKIFLIAAEEERVKRRFEQLKHMNQQVSYERVREEMRERDRIDRERDLAPLRQAEDAIAVDTTGRSVEDIVDQIITLCGQKQQS